MVAERLVFVIGVTDFGGLPGEYGFMVKFWTAVLLSAIFLCYSSTALKEGTTCVVNGNCDQGLHCETCLANGNVRPRCTRIQPVQPISKVRRLPFNRYSWLTTHNSYARLGERSAIGNVILAPQNQQDSITSQLNNGVRGLMLDMYDFLGDIWLCHSFGGNCYNYTAFQPAINVLKEIQIFLEGNPTEIVTLIIEDYVTSPKGLSRVFNASGLMKFWFPVSQMPKDGVDWPTVDDMITQNHRLLVFTSKASKEASEGIAYEWNYIVENQYGNDGMAAGSCRNRSESSAMNTKSRSLVLMNYFRTLPDPVTACKDNSAPLAAMMDVCYNASGQRWPNFIAVDYYKRSDGGGAPAVVDKANAELLCGCTSLSFCTEGTTFGHCQQHVATTAPVGAPSMNSRAGIVSQQMESLVLALFLSVILRY